MENITTSYQYLGRALFSCAAQGGQNRGQHVESLILEDINYVQVYRQIFLL